jgi:hypothetical protein
MLLELLIVELEALLRKIEYSVEKLGSVKVQPTKEEYHAFESLNTRLAEVSVKFTDTTDSFKEAHAEWVSHEAARFIARIDASNADLLATGRPRSFAIFKKNLMQIFEGLTDSSLDSRSVRSRNKQTNARCDRVRSLSPIAIVVWAASLPPTMWAAGAMKDHEFDYVAEKVETTQTQGLPPELEDMLHALSKEEPLRGSQTFQTFIQG